MSKSYYFEGLCRMNGAIGIREPFCASVKAESYDQAVIKLYETREHISIHLWTESTDGKTTDGTYFRNPSLAEEE